MIEQPLVVNLFFTYFTVKYSHLKEWWISQRYGVNFIFVLHPTWRKYMLYRNMEATASFTCIIHTVVRRWTLNKGVVPVRFLFYTHWQECTTDINIDITRLAVIVECICPEVTNSAFYKIVESIHLKQESMIGVKWGCSYRQLM